MASCPKHSSYPEFRHRSCSKPSRRRGVAPQSLVQEHNSLTSGVASRRVTIILALCAALLAIGSLVGCQVVVSRAPLSSRSLSATGVPTARATATPARLAAVLPSPKPPAMPTPSPTATAAPLPSPAQSPPTRIVAPAIGLDAPVVPIGWHQEKQNGQLVSIWDVASHAAGWHKNSVYPGQLGNVVLSGHHNIDGEVFRHVVDLKPGDRVTLYAEGVPYVYVVTLRLIVPEKGVPLAQKRQNARWIGPTRDARLTLVTCWPYTNNTHRVIVVAKLPDDNAKLARRQ